MRRSVLLLSILGFVLIVVLYWFLLFQPASDEIDELRAQTEQLESQAAQLEARVAELREVRDAAVEEEALLVAAEAIIPSEPALPAVLRQMQQAADDSGLLLSSVTSSRPTAFDAEDAPPNLSVISVTADLEGSYFQVVDFLRRLEDPTISPRGISFRSLTASGEPAEHPVLQVSLSADLFAFVAQPAPEEPEEEPADEPADGEEPAEGEETEGGDEPLDDADDEEGAS